MIKANRVADMLLSRGIGKGNKVAILLMNCLEFLPIYFGILKTGAVVVPMNFRFSARRSATAPCSPTPTFCCSARSSLAVWRKSPTNSGEKRLLMYVGAGVCPTFAEDY